MVTPNPYFINHPKLEVSLDGTTAIAIDCSVNEVHTNVKQDENVIDTFCGSWTNYKQQVWDVTLHSVQSFDPTGVWTVLQPLVGKLVQFQVWPDKTIANSAANPIMFGSAMVKAIPFIDGKLGEASEFDVVLAVQGMPQWAPPATAPTWGMAAEMAADLGVFSASVPPEPEPEPESERTEAAA
jgi:hypothetical protein